MIDILLLRLMIIYTLILAGAILKLLIRCIDDLSKIVSVLLVYILMPVVVFTSITRFNEALVDFRILIFSSLIFFISSVLAYLFFKVFKEKRTNVSPYVLASVNPNGFYLPFPIVYALHGVKGLTYSTVYLLTANIANAFYVYPLYSYYSRNHRRKSVTLIRRILLFPPFIASILGLAFLSFGFSFPPQLAQSSSYLGQLTTYIALFYVGLKINIKGNGLLSKKILGVAAIRLMILPFIIFGLMRILGLNEAWGEVIIIHSGMPPAVNNIVLTDYFGLNKELMGNIVTVVTFLTLLTLPLLIYLGQSL